MMTDKYQCSAEHARVILDWLRTRGGVAIWRSANLSNPGASWVTPAQSIDGSPMQKPKWEARSEPERIITSIDDIEVCVDKEVKRFHVATRMGGNGLMIKVTDGGSRRIRREVERAGPGAYHLFDYNDYKNAVIMAPESVIPLAEWADTMEGVVDGKGTGN